MPAFKKLSQKGIKYLGNMIRLSRLKQGISTKEFAEKCGLEVGYILQIEIGKFAPKVDKLEKMSKVLRDDRLTIEYAKCNSTSSIRCDELQRKVNILMKGNEKQVLNDDDLEIINKIKLLKSGDKIVYYTGFSIAQENPQLQLVIADLLDHNVINIAQKKLAMEKYEYIAFKR